MVETTIIDIAIAIVQFLLASAHLIDLTIWGQPRRSSSIELKFRIEYKISVSE